MPKQGDWSFEVRVDGAALREHTIENKKVVQAQPGKEFEVYVEYGGLDGLWMLECWIDGKLTNPRHFLDPARQTSRGGQRDLTFNSWTKSQDGHQIKHKFLFAGASAAKGDDDEEGFSRPSVATWDHGQVEIKIYQGAYSVLHSDCSSANRARRRTARLLYHWLSARARDSATHVLASLFRLCALTDLADLNKRAAVDEKTMVKSGLSVAAGAGSKSFSQGTMWRAGESVVCRAPGDPLVASLSCFYRDSFFMCLREDTCCGGRCAPNQGGAASSSDLRSAADTLATAGAGSSVARDIRDKAVRERETREALARKRPKDEGPIDLCTSDEDE